MAIVGACMMHAICCLCIIAAVSMSVQPDERTRKGSLL